MQCGSSLIKSVKCCCRYCFDRYHTNGLQYETGNARTLSILYRSLSFFIRMQGCWRQIEKILHYFFFRWLPDHYSTQSYKYYTKSQCCSLMMLRIKRKPTSEGLYSPYLRGKHCVTTRSFLADLGVVARSCFEAWADTTFLRYEPDLVQLESLLRSSDHVLAMRNVVVFCSRDHTLHIFQQVKKIYFFRVSCSNTFRY